MNAMCPPNTLSASKDQSDVGGRPYGLWPRVGAYLVRKHGKPVLAAYWLQERYGIGRSASFDLVRGQAKSTDWLEQFLADEGLPLLEALFPELLAQRDAAAERLRDTLASRADAHIAAGGSQDVLCVTRTMLRPDLEDLIRRTEGGWVRRAVALLHGGA